MSEVAVFSNPIRRRRRRNRSGQFVKRRRHRNPESRARRSAAARRGAQHRRRRHRNPIALRRYSRRRHRNPIAGTMGEMSNVIIPATIGAAGALGLNILLGKISFLPATLQSGYGRAGVQIAAALAIGALGSKVGLSRRTAGAIAAGITVIALYDVASTVIASKFPTLNLGETFASLPGGVMTGANVKQFQPTGMGEVFGPNAVPHPALRVIPSGGTGTFG